MAEKKNIFLRIFTGPIVRNLVAMIALGVLLIAVTLFMLDGYTRHNQSIVVPNLKGLQLDAVKKSLATVDLEYEISDSIYSADGTPGSVLEQSPIADSRIKEGRKVFITIQAISPKLVAIPSLKDYSRRQAQAQLKSLGFEQVRIRQVPSLYADVVLRINHKGDSLVAGQRLPKGTPLELVIGAGGLKPPADEKEDDEKTETTIDPLLSN